MEPTDGEGVPSCTELESSVDNRATDEGVSQSYYQHGDDGGWGHNHDLRFLEDNEMTTWGSQHSPQSMRWDENVDYVTVGGEPVPPFGGSHAIDFDDFDDLSDFDEYENNMSPDFLSPNVCGDESPGWEGCSQAADDEALQNFEPASNTTSTQPFEGHCPYEFVAEAPWSLGSPGGV